VNKRKTRFTSYKQSISLRRSINHHLLPKLFKIYLLQRMIDVSTVCRDARWRHCLTSLSIKRWIRRSHISVTGLRQNCKNVQKTVELLIASTDLLACQI